MVRYMCKIVVLQDEWPLSDKGYDLSPDADRFARNVAWWFAGDGKKGNFLAYSTNMALTGKKIAESMAADGHTWTCDVNVPMTLETLKEYDGLFLADNAVDTALLTEYCKGGGNVFVVGGTTNWTHFNPFVKDFGFAFADKRDAFKGPVDFSGSTTYHPIMKDVSSLYMAGGSEISDISPDRNHDILVPGFLGVYDYLCKYHNAFKENVLIGCAHKGKNKKTADRYQRCLWMKESLCHDWKEIMEDGTNGANFNPTHVTVKHHGDGTMWIYDCNKDNYWTRKNLRSNYVKYADGQKECLDMSFEPWATANRLWVLDGKGQIIVHQGDSKWWDTTNTWSTPPEKLRSFCFGSNYGGGIFTYVSESGYDLYTRGGWKQYFHKAKRGNIPVCGICPIDGGYAAMGKEDGELYVRHDINNNGEWLACPKFGTLVGTMKDVCLLPKYAM